ncbi:MAG TPA: sulfatase-like hydrolase/transferase [Bryobacteraceae bacterium]|nr:sulfatase-like hydrolase/transferase [Bryobacteraceae bacterium]
MVLIIADDLGWGDIAINGAPDIRTPNIDGIARGGVRFTQAYANAPECTPTRCALMTGRYQQRAGGLECAIGVNNIGRYDEAEWLQKRGELGLPASEQTISKMFQAAGYDTALTGKWHLGYLEKHWPREHGFQYSFGILGGNADYYTHEEQGEGAGKTQMFENGSKVRRQGYMTDLIADAAIGWLKQRTSKPFFLYLPFTAPHSPIQAPEDFDPRTGTAPHRPKHRPTYAKMVERLDTRIGDVLRQLDAMGVARNTIVVFASDNGGDANGRNDPFKGRKSSVFEGGIRAPLHIRWPGVIPAGRAIPQVAMTMDLAPTLLGAVGAGGSARFDGIDLMPFLNGTQTPVRRTVFWRYKRGTNIRKAVRHGRLKYVDDNGVKALYDLRVDSKETTDLLKSRPDAVKDLEDRLAAWEKDVESPRLKEFRKGHTQC